jgi:flavorubredoxin
MTDRGGRHILIPMNTNIHEIADGVYRLSTVVQDAAPGGFTFNQYLLTGDEPMLFHTGARQLFPLVSEAVAKVIAVDQLRWISFGHVEADESGAMNQWLGAAPRSEVLFNGLGVMVSLNDLSDRPPVMAEPATPQDLGTRTVRTIPTPHVPHGWEAQVLFDETTRTLFCGDLFSQIGEGPAIVHDADIIQPALDAEDLFGATALTANTAPTIRQLADLEPRTLALMHGPAFAGDCRQALLDLADAYEARFASSVGMAGSVVI